SPIRLRTRACEWGAQGQMGLGPVGPTAASPAVSLRSFSTSGVHEPHEAEALVSARTLSMLVRAFSTIALVIAPLQTPLQPQTSASSAIAATAAAGSRPRRPSVAAWPNTKVSRRSETSAPDRI